MTRHHYPSHVAFCFAVLSLAGCSAFGLAAAKKQQQQLQAQAAAQQEQADQQQKLAEAQERYLTEQLDAQVYPSGCDELQGEVEKVIVDMGRTPRPEGPSMVVTNWDFVQAKYETTYDHRVRETRKPSKNRYVVELESVAEGCRVAAKFQRADDQGERSDRALDLETRLLQRAAPDRYAEIDAGLAAIE